MSSFLKVAVPLVLVAAVVAVIAYLSQNTTKGPPGIEVKDGKPTPTEGDLFYFDEDRELQTDAPPPMVVEIHSHQHKDYWFYTTQERDVLLTLWSKSCGCADVQFGTFSLSDPEWESLVASPTPGALLQLLKSVKFEDLSEAKRNQYSTIHGTPKGRRPKPYVLRLNWEVKEPKSNDGNVALTIQVNGMLEGGNPQQSRRGVNFKVVPATGFWPGSLDVGDLTPGSNISRECIVWSQTRDRLDFSVRMTAAGDSRESEPLAEVSPPERLSEEELANFARVVFSPQDKNSKLSCAYRFRLTLFERRGEQQLEMGPLIRRLVIKFQRSTPEEDALPELRSTIAAYVRGEVNVLSGDDVGRVSLGTFRFDRQQKLDVRLASPDPTLGLEVDSCTHEKMHIKLDDPKTIDGRREWVMHVELEPSSLIGDFTHYILLRVKDKPGRKLRIPINGSAGREK